MPQRVQIETLRIETVDININFYAVVEAFRLANVSTFLINLESAFNFSLQVPSTRCFKAFFSCQNVSFCQKT